MAVVPSAFGFAGSFTPPIRTAFGQAEPWQFAVNSRGQAVAVRGLEVFPVDKKGHLGKPWEVKLPQATYIFETSVTMDSGGRIALGILYQDSTAPRITGGKEGLPGCCLRAAVVTWRLGEKPPVAQSLSPPQDAASGEEHHALQAPLMVIGRKAVTALWTVGSTRESEGYPELGEVEIEQAYGRFGSPLKSAEVSVAADGLFSPHLSLEQDGDPVASWLEDTNKLGLVTGSSTGKLAGDIRVQQVPELSRPAGMTSNDEGDTVFAYFSRSSKTTSELRYMNSHDAGPFGPPRGIGLTGSETPQGTVTAGGHHTLLAFWGSNGEEERGKFLSMSGAFGRSFKPPGNSEGFVDSDGRAVVVYDYDSPVAVTSDLGRPFTAPQEIGARLRGFALGAERDDEPPLPTSPDGHAILYFSRDETESEQYLVRYTP
jgi:hypothetical protein